MTYVLGDIHGNKRRFNSIMKQIELQRSDTLYVLGDVIDRNSDGIRILRQIMAMPNAVMLLGNHEHMMLQTLYWPVEGDKKQVKTIREENKYRWYRNGGYITHSSIKHTQKTIRQEIFEYLDNLPVNVDVEVNGRKFLLTHAAPTEDFLKRPSKYDDAKMFAVWYRYNGYE